VRSFFKYLLFFCGSLQGVLAQDFHLSMYDAAPLFLNPAMTGLIEGKIRAHAHYRNQWGSVASRPFNTSLISLDMPSGKWGFGGQISNERGGSGNYNILQLVGSAAYSIPIDKSAYHNLSFGLQAGFNQKRVEYQLLTFESQWTTNNGGTFDRSVPSNETFQGSSFFTEAVNFGFLYFYGKQQTRLNPFVGASGFNLTRPRDSFLGGDARLPRRYYFHGGARLNVSEIFYLIPKVLVYTQAGIVQQTYALDAGYFFKGEKFFVLAGYILRPNDASILYGGLKKENYIVKISYDFNTSSLRTTTKTRGAYEISLTWLGKKSKSSEIKNCPRL
jgi:type IX secretion system PorP/SprF family membrane protein